jgi:hypothetical protein
VIKTNRILQTPFSREVGESLPREYRTLYERGSLANGLFRGFIFALVASNASEVAAQALNAPILAGGTSLIATALFNPLHIITIKR